MNALDGDKEDSAMLEDDDYSDDYHYRRPAKQTLKKHLLSYYAPVLIGIVVSVLLTTIFWAAKLRHISRVDRDCRMTTDRFGFLPSSDLLDFVDYEPPVGYWKGSPYSGYPTEEQGQAWEGLQQVRGTRVSRNEGAQIHLPNGLSVDDDTHATILGVMHNMHCLRMIKQYLYPEYYYPDLSAMEMQKWRNHSDHCIETLRESVTCLPDLTPHALEWADEEERVHVNLKPVVKRQCVNWRSLVSWERQREYHLDDLWRANPPGS